MYVAIDFETANSDHKSVVSVGIAFRKDNQIFSKEWLIKPPADTIFEKEFHVNIHHITPDKVKDSPYFPAVWKEIKQVIGDSPILIAHNAKSMERSSLRSLFAFYKMGEFELPIFCTCELSRQLFPHLSSHELDKMTTWFDIGLNNHHNAEEDARACLELYEALQSPEKVAPLYDKIERYYTENYAYVPSSHLKKREKSLLLQNSIEKIIDRADNRFRDLNIAFSGELDFNNSKEFVKSIINRLGANYKTCVSKKTNLLILSPFFHKLSVEKQYVSTKYVKACEIQENGGDIKIISWSEFIKMCSTNPY